MTSSRWGRRGVRVTVRSPQQPRPAGSSNMTTVRQREAEMRTYLPTDTARCSWPLHGQLLLPSRRGRMLRRWMTGAKCEAGFTLVEVIVALAILSAGLGLLLGL